MSWDDTDQKIPMIDFKPLSVNQRRFLNTVESEIDQDEERVCTDICEAFKNIGFVYLKNTGITEEEVKFYYTINILYNRPTRLKVSGNS